DGAYFCDAFCMLIARFMYWAVSTQAIRTVDDCGAGLVWMALKLPIVGFIARRVPLRTPDSIALLTAVG
ncbi:hypothetical protein Q604_UNBC01304G0001, partial [human gut metagenome]